MTKASVRHSLPNELKPINKITHKRFEFIVPTEKSKMTMQQTFGSNYVTILEDGSPKGSTRQSPRPPSNQKTRSATSQSGRASDRGESSPSSSRSQKSEQEKPKSVLEDERSIELRNSLINEEEPNFDEVDLDDLKILQSHLKEYTIVCASKGEYVEARKSDNLNKKVTNKIYHSVHDVARSDSPRTKYEEKYNKAKQDWENELAEFDEETNSEMEHLKECQSKEMERFESSWDEVSTRKYRKASGRLLQLWRNEKFLARKGDFEEAAVVRAEADELCKREMAAAEAAMNRDFHYQKEQLEKDHQEEIRRFEEERGELRSIIESRHRTEASNLENLRNAVEVRMKEPPRTKVAQKSIRKREAPSRASFAPPGEVVFAHQTILPPLPPPAELSSISSARSSASRKSSSKSSVHSSTSSKPSAKSSSKPSGKNSAREPEKFSMKGVIVDGVTGN